MFFPIHRSGCCVCVCLNSVTGCGCYLEAALDMKSKFGLFMFVLLFGWSKIIIWVLIILLCYFIRVLFLRRRV